MDEAISSINNLLENLRNIPGISASGFTAGDEFEVVLQRPSIMLDVIHLVRFMLSVECRIGLGLGVIENPENNFPNQMYGSAFTRARDALNRSKKFDVEMYVVTHNKKFNKNVNTVLSLLSFIRKKMTFNQKRMYDSFLYYQNFENVKLQTEFADIMNVTDAMVSKTLKNIGYDELVNGERLIEELLTDFYDELVPLP